MKSIEAISTRVVFATACSILLCLAMGCASVGRISGQTGTDVQLSKNNYKIIKAGAKGESYGFSLFGIIPLGSPNYADAKEALYKSVGEPLTGKAVALANQTEDRSTLYLILFSIPKVTVTADVIEFTEQPTSK
jgi:hypothetical protein